MSSISRLALILLLSIEIVAPRPGLAGDPAISKAPHAEKVTAQNETAIQSNPAADADVETDADLEARYGQALIDMDTPIHRFHSRRTFADLSEADLAALYRYAAATPRYQSQADYLKLALADKSVTKPQLGALLRQFPLGSDERQAAASELVHRMRQEGVVHVGIVISPEQLRDLEKAFRNWVNSKQGNQFFTEFKWEYLSGPIDAASVLAQIRQHLKAEMTKSFSQSVLGQVGDTLKAIGLDRNVLEEIAQSFRGTRKTLGIFVPGKEADELFSQSIASVIPHFNDVIARVAAADAASQVDAMGGLGGIIAQNREGYALSAAEQGAIDALNQREENIPYVRGPLNNAVETRAYETAYQKAGEGLAALKGTVTESLFDSISRSIDPKWQAKNNVEIKVIKAAPPPKDKERGVTADPLDRNWAQEPYISFYDLKYNPSTKRYERNTYAYRFLASEPLGLSGDKITEEILTSARIGKFADSLVGTPQTKGSVR